MGIIKKIFIVLFIIVCLFGVWGTFFPGNESKQQETEQPTTSDEWKTYTNKTYGYALQYPSSLTLSEENAYTTIFQKQEKRFGKLSFPNLSLSIIPEKNGQDKDIYNFISKEIIDRFFLMNDGESQLIEPQADPTYWTYTKLATIPVAGTDAIVIQNDRVWEGDEGVHNRRIILRDTKGLTYIIGSYYQTQEELTTLQRFVESFTLPQQ